MGNTPKGYLTWINLRVQKQMRLKWNPNSFGGIKGRSTTHAIAKVTSLNSRLRKKKVPHINFIEDSQKAFDLIDRPRTMESLNTKLSDPELMERITARHEQIVAVTIEGTAETRLIVDEGVPQGDPNGPPFFIAGYDTCVTNIQQSRPPEISDPMTLT